MTSDGSSTAGLVLHVIYPLKPLRMMDGFVDTAAVLGPDPYKLGISSGANQLAAMPSLHVGWALLIALGAIWISTSKMKWMALAHPALTLGVVVLTANHYWADAMAVVASVFAAWRILPSSESTKGRSARERCDPLVVESRHEEHSHHEGHDHRSHNDSEWSAHLGGL